MQKSKLQTLYYNTIYLWLRLITSVPYSKRCSVTKTSLRITLHAKQKRLPSSMKLLLHIFVNILFNICKTHPFSLGTDGSNDTGLEKMNRVCLKILDVNRSKKVTSHSLNMCLTSGKNASIAACIFDKINEKVIEYGLPWENCVNLSVDNANAMIGRTNSIASRFKQKNERFSYWWLSLPLCTYSYSNANDSFSQHIELNVEDVVVDLFY